MQTLVLPTEQEQYYKDHKSREVFQAEGQSQSISLSPPIRAAAIPGKNVSHRGSCGARSRQPASSQKIRGGADFVAMVKQYSDDEESKKG